MKINYNLLLLIGKFWKTNRKEFASFISHHSNVVENCLIFEFKIKIFVFTVQNCRSLSDVVVVVADTKANV